MSESISMLQLEHLNFAKLLSIIEQQLRVLEEGGSLDHALLELILVYFSDYPGQCHHPKEDLIYRKLQQRSPAKAHAIADLLAEHEEIGERVKKVAQVLVHAWKEPAGDAASSLRSALQGFVEMHREHMAAEERSFFPTARKELTTDDFAEIDFELFDRRDPIFHQEAETRFKALRSEITRLALKSAERTASPAQLEIDRELLAGASSLDQFNAVMKSRSLRLVRREGGGYDLEEGGRSLADIPDCSEARAVWCACFFLRGRDVVSDAKVT
jgi:hemerythrin-like domain-containing protein